MLLLLAKVLAVAVIIHAPCPDPSAGGSCTVPPDTIYLTSDQLLGPAVVYHELGHIVDFEFLSPSDRTMFKRLTHDTGQWWTPDEVARGDAPAERFAEAFRLCVHSTKWPAQFTGGYLPSVKTHRRVCRWLAEIGKRPADLQSPSSFPRT